MANEPSHKGGSDDDTVEPLTTKHLDDIIQGVSASKSTWADLRQLYPPRQSGFAPRHSSASIPASKLGGDSEADDEAYSQAATMAAYGMELLRIAVSRPQINRRLTRQTSRLLATLCATLICTRDRHRDMADKAAGENVNDSKPSRDVGAASSESANIYPAKRSRSMEQSRHSCKAPHGNNAGQNDSLTLHCTSECKQPSCGCESSLELTDLSSEFSCQEKRRHCKHAKRSRRGSAKRGSARADLHPPDEVSCAISNRRVSSAEKYAQVATPITPITSATELPSHGGAEAERYAGSSSGDDASASGIESDDESDLVLGQGQVVRLHRRFVVRNALMDQGLSESAATAFFDRWSKGTNIAYDSLWNRWVTWCDKRELDPLKRSEEQLAACVSEITVSASSASNTRVAIRSVWSVVDGTTQVDTVCGL